MSGEKPSLLSGRNPAPLSEDEVKRAANIFLGLDKNVNVRYVETSRTLFRVGSDEQSGTEYGEIVFGPDIYPGGNIIDPNSAVTVDGAAAHELTHYYRWKDKAVLEDPSLNHIDEALTSLEAIFRFSGQLNETDKIRLVGDAIQRLKLYVRERASGGAAVVAESEAVQAGEAPS